MRELPAGTVTFLFTDIEGSTRLLQELGRDGYVRALTEHRRLLREAFTGHGGVEVEMQGDSFHFAFPFAREAVAAAVAGQRALHEHEWESQPIRVRVGLHTGEPVQADGLYAGLDVHAAARVMSAGHGGQVLVSQRTVELVEGELDAGIALLDLGEHRLKDLSAPRRLYQAVSEGLSTGFPALKSLRQTNLPVPATPFLGREDDLAAVVEKLQRADVRLPGDGIEALADVAAAQGEDRRAATLWGAGGAIRAEAGKQMEVGQWDIHVEAVAGVQARLSASAWAEAWAKGEALAPPDAVVLALGERDADGGAVRPQS